MLIYEKLQTSHVSQADGYTKGSFDFGKPFDFFLHHHHLEGLGTFGATRVTKGRTKPASDPEGMLRLGRLDTSGDPPS